MTLYQKLIIQAMQDRLADAVEAYTDAVNEHFSGQTEASKVKMDRLKANFSMVQGAYEYAVDTFTE